LKINRNVVVSLSSDISMLSQPGKRLNERKSGFRQEYC
jgi:hypothetical protein